MQQTKIIDKRRVLGTAPVFFTAISTILGAVLFLRFGFAVGTLGFWGTFLIIILGHFITIPTSLAISEIATNKRVEGGGEYFIISRSFGLKIGSTIGVALFFSQAISIAFYIIAFTEAFTPLFNWWQTRFGYELPRQAISIPSLFLLAVIVLRGIGSGMKMLYLVCFLLFSSLFLFFIGKPIEYVGELSWSMTENFGFFNKEHFFLVFAVCFPAFTGMTAGVGLSGDLKDPGKSIPWGTMGGTLAGLLIYLLVIFKLSVSASQADLQADQLIMSRIALWGGVAVPIGLAAATFSSALGSILVAPRTLQAIACDQSIPMGKMNHFLAKGKGDNLEPKNAALVSFLIALVFILPGNIDAVAEIISMFFLISYGSLCLISFLNHFGSSPSYRPRFKSKWYFSLGGFLLSVWVMFMINLLYTLVAFILIIGLYLFIGRYNKSGKGLVDIFEGALFQLNRRIRVFMQKKQADGAIREWRPAAICISPHSYGKTKVLDLMKWISYQHGFGTYFHYIEGYYSKQTVKEAQEVLYRLIAEQEERGGGLYIDTMISPSYTSAIAQAVQTASVSGMENNMVVFEYDKENPQELTRIVDSMKLVKAGGFDLCIFANSPCTLQKQGDIHIWVKDNNEDNASLMILLSYIIMSHPDWERSQIKIFVTTNCSETEHLREVLAERIEAGRLPITMTNIEIVVVEENQSVNEVIAQNSEKAGLTVIGFKSEVANDEPEKFFTAFRGLGDILFVSASQTKSIT